MVKKISVLVVDDSAFMRKALKRMLDSDPMIKVVGMASDGLEGIECVKKLRPDVVTLDVKMYGMDGIEALRRIMKECPTPALMVSSLTSEGGAVTLQALEIGAVDFIDKSSCHTAMDILEIADSLVMKVKTIAGVDLKKVVTSRPVDIPVIPIARPAAPPVDGVPSHIVTIGASTGGPMSLERVLKSIPKDYPGAILVVQHMPPGFTQSFAERLNHQCKVDVSEAVEQDPVSPGRIYVAPGGYHLKLTRDTKGLRVLLSKTPRDAPHIPSIDVMMKSVAETWPGRKLGIIMTGMGQDGTEGAQVMKRCGGEIIAQNEETCVVYGMPKAAYISGTVDRMVSLHNIAGEICRFNNN